jgi:hypothetical protein
LKKTRPEEDAGRRPGGNSEETGRRLGRRPGGRLCGNLREKEKSEPSEKNGECRQFVSVCLFQEKSSQEALSDQKSSQKASDPPS